ncbi:MAG: 4'-phosphopantetheinyl transferase superfamily protein [Blastocatellia bacterium]
MMNPPVIWSPPPDQQTLAPDEVHVWRAPLELPAEQLEKLWLTLAPDEQQRAGRFHFERDRHHFIAAHGMLRVLLGRYLRLSPQELNFITGPWGKPALRPDCRPLPLHFNLSHSHQLALYAFTLHRETGVDVEFIKPDFASLEIARSFFSPREVAQLGSLPVAEQTQAFFNCWTRKEAYIKARGEGLSLPLDQFDVSLLPGEPARLLRMLSDERETMRWRMEALQPGPGYAGAVMVEGHDWQLSCREWRPTLLAE